MGRDNEWGYARIQGELKKLDAGDVFADETLGESVEVDKCHSHVDGEGIHADPDKGLGPFAFTGSSCCLYPIQYTHLK